MRLPLIIFIGYFSLLAASLIAQETETSAQSNELKSQAHFDELLQKAKGGGMDAAFRAGTAYLMGRGVKQDNKEAAKWISLAAKQPNAEIAATWACMLLRGVGCEVNIPEAAKWFRKSVELGGPGVESSNQHFGRVFGSRTLVWAGTPEMVVLYLKASVDNDAESQFKYAELNHQGIYLRYDDNEAIKWWKKAGENGHAEAQFKVAESYAVGRGAKQSETEAAKWYQMAATQGHQEAQYKLGMIYSYGHGVTKDEVAAVKLFLKAAEQGHTKASTAIGRRYLEGKGVSKDLSKAADWLIKAALKDDADGQFLLGFMFRNGLGMTVNYEEAGKWFSLAADEGDEAAQFHLGTLYAEGNGVPKNELIAYKWLLLAKAKGIQESTKLIEFIEKKLSPEQRAEVQKIAGEFVPKKERETKKRIQEMREKREEMRSRMFDPVSGNDKGDIKAKEPRVNTNGNK